MTDTIKVIFESADGASQDAVTWQVEDYARSVGTGSHAVNLREAAEYVERKLGPGVRVISMSVNEVEQP